MAGETCRCWWTVLLLIQQGRRLSVMHTHTGLRSWHPVQAEKLQLPLKLHLRCYPPPEKQREKKIYTKSIVWHSSISLQSEMGKVAADCTRVTFVTCQNKMNQVRVKSSPVKISRSKSFFCHFNWDNNTINLNNKITQIMANSATGNCVNFLCLHSWNSTTGSPGRFPIAIAFSVVFTKMCHFEKFCACHRVRAVDSISLRPVV